MAKNEPVLEPVTPDPDAGGGGLADWAARQRSKEEIEAKRAELTERITDPKVKHGALLSLGAAIEALSWVLGDESDWM